MIEKFGEMVEDLVSKRNHFLESEDYKEFQKAQKIFLEAQQKLENSEANQIFRRAELNVRMCCPADTSIKTAGATVSYVKGHERSSWNSKTLKELELKYPEISVAKETTYIEPTCRIAYSKEGD
jgi:hypothetical protein